MNARSFLAALAAAVVVFIWQSISHMALSWSHDSIRPFKDAAAVEQAITANAPADGIYMTPHAPMGDKEAMTAAHKQAVEGISVFAIVSLDGKRSFGECLVWQFGFNLLGALFVTFLLSKLSHDGMGCRVGVTVFFSLFAVATAVLPNWAWWAFSNSYTGFVIFDHVVGWTLAGFVLAKLVPKNETSDEDAADSPEPVEAD